MATKRAPHAGKGKPISRIELNRMLELVAEGKTISQIAHLTGRSTTGTNQALLAVPEDYEEAKERRRDYLRSIQWDVGTNSEHKDFRFFHDKLSLIHLPEYREAIRESISPPATVPPLVLEGGRRPVSIADVAQLASELGIRIAIGVDGGDARGALPAAEDVLPDPPPD